MKNFTKKILAVVLTLCILMSGMITAFAVEATDPAYKMLFDKGEIFRTTNISTSQEVTISFDYYLADGSIIVDDTGVSGYSTALKAGKVSSFSLTFPSSGSAHSFRFTAKSVTAELYIWNVKIAKASSEELTFENRTDRTTCEFTEITYADIPEMVEKNFVLLVDTTSLADDGNANKSFWFNELGMSGYGDLANGTYTVQFDVCPVTLAQSGSKFHFRTSSGSGASSDAGFWKPELTVGEWTTTSSTFTVTDDTTTGNHILFVYGGFKGYVDNLVILDSEGNEVAGTYTDMGGLYVPDKHVDYLTVDYFVVENEPEVELSDDYAIYQDSSAATTNYDTYFHCYDYSTVGSAEKHLPAGEYKVTMDVYAQAIGDLVYKPIKDWTNADEQKYWTPTEDDLNKWVTVTYTGTTTTGANLHTIIYCQGFKGYVDNITVYSGETALYTLSFTASENGKAGHDNNGAGVVGALPKDIADAKIPAPEVELSDDYAIYQDSSAATTNYDTYFHIYDYSTYGSAEKEVPVGEYKVTMDVYTQSIGTLAYKAITGGWKDADSQKYWTPTEDDLNKWVTVTFAGTTTDIAKLHSLIYVQGFKGYVDNITVYTGETELYTLSFTESDNGKAGHADNGAGVVGALPKDIADAKAPVEDDIEPAPTDNYVVLIDNSANGGFGQFYLHEVGMAHDATYPIGDYTIKFDYYPLVNGSSKNIVAHLTATGWSGDAFPGSQGQKWLEVNETIGQWQTISFDITTIAEGQFPWFYVGAGMKGYFDNYQIINKATGETVLDFSPVEADLGKTSKGTATVVEFEEYVEPDCVVLVDNSANGGFGQFYLHEVGMAHDATYPIGDYTVKFDYYPIVNGSSKNIVAHLTATGWSGDAFPGSQGQKWLEVNETLGEWQTVSFDITTIAEGQFPWFYIGAGMKGYFDNYQIINKATGETVLDFSPRLADLGKTSKDIATVVEFEAIHVHTAGEAVVENKVNATCSTVGTYDEVVYCTECNEELSRTTVTNDILLIDTTKLDNGTPTSFWFNELGMKGYGTLPNGTYTVQFDVCPVVIPEGGNLFHYRTGSGSGPSSDAGWWKGDLTAGEWTTTSNTFTVKEGTTTGNHILYVYGGFKGYVDNIVILDAEGNAVAGTFTGITGLNVPEKHTQYLTVANKYEHTAGDVVRENEVEGTCQVAACYDEVVYCSVCNAELSRTTITEEIDENNHSFTDDNDVDCNNEGCDYVRVSEEIGDLNGDYAVNNKDLGLLMQHINGWEVEINLELADVNNDGNINNKDYGLLMRFVNGWDVTLG